MSKISKEDAQRIKAQFYLLSPLERVGIFGGLSKDETDMLRFVNGLNGDLAVELFYFLDGIERLVDDNPLNIPSRYQRDVARLNERGIYLDDPERMAFIYGLLVEKFDGNGHHQTDNLGKAAQMKAFSWSQNKIDLLEDRSSSLVDQNLQDTVEQEVRKVEKYLTVYFAAVMPIIQEILPLDIQIESRKISITLDKDRWDKKWKPKDFHRYEERYDYSFITPYGIKVKHPTIKTGRYDSEDTTMVLEKSGSPLILFEATDAHPALQQSIFGQAVPHPIPYKFERVPEKKEFKLRLKKPNGSLFYSEEIDKALRSLLIGDKGVIAYEELSKNDDLILSNKYKAFASLYLGYELVYKRDPKNPNKFRLRRLKRSGIIVDKNYIIKNAEPLFVFRDFFVSKYSLGTYQHFWDSLRGYAQLPVSLTDYLVNAFRDNYLKVPGVDLEKQLTKVQEGLEQLAGIVGDVQTKGRLNGTPNVPLLEK